MCDMYEDRHYKQEDKISSGEGRYGESIEHGTGFHAFLMGSFQTGRKIMHVTMEHRCML